MSYRTQVIIPVLSVRAGDVMWGGGGGGAVFMPRCSSAQRSEGRSAGCVRGESGL